jgi:hypothetical protein
VAGIIAGEQVRTETTPEKDMRAVLQELGDNAKGTFKEKTLDTICGMAPKCKLVSLKVLDKFGDGNSSKVIAAIAQIQTINAHGRELHIHGVNISIGYPFEAKWFACGHSPLCVEINRLVKSGVVVVAAAGNTGYGTLQTASGPSETCLDLTINDPAMRRRRSPWAPRIEKSRIAMACRIFLQRADGRRAAQAGSAGPGERSSRARWPARS